MNCYYGIFYNIELKLMSGFVGELTTNLENLVLKVKTESAKPNLDGNLELVLENRQNLRSLE